MSWIFLEGLDKSGKSTVAKKYEKKGYEVVHMNAPDKKYMEPGYIGPSYLDECMNMYMNYSGRDVVFDRTVYGELVWPNIFNRLPQLSEEDFDALREIEKQNDTQYIFMYDKDRDAHFKRIVEFDEPINIDQFHMASSLYEIKLVEGYSFVKKTFFDYVDKEDDTEKDTPSTDVEPVVLDGQYDYKLNMATAIKKILSTRIIRKKGELYDKIEFRLREVLEEMFKELFTEQQEEDKLTKEEIFILKRYVKVIKQKVGEKQHG